MPTPAPFRTDDATSHATAILAQTLGRNGIIPEPAVAAFLQASDTVLAKSAVDLPPVTEYSTATAEKDIKIKTLRYIEIANYLLANKDLSTQEIADRFQVTPATIIRVIGTDGFQYILHEEAKKLATVYKGMRSDFEQKLQAGAHLALDRLIERIQVSNDTAQLLEIVSKFSELMGMGSKGGPTVMVNNYGITGDHLRHAAVLRPVQTYNAIAESPQGA